jgi:hypothetical protein
VSFNFVKDGEYEEHVREMNEARSIKLKVMAKKITAAIMDLEADNHLDVANAIFISTAKYIAHTVVSGVWVEADADGLCRLITRDIKEVWRSFAKQMEIEAALEDKKEAAIH